MANLDEIMAKLRGNQAAQVATLAPSAPPAPVDTQAAFFAQAQTTARAASATPSINPPPVVATVQPIAQMSVADMMALARKAQAPAPVEVPVAQVASAAPVAKTADELLKEMGFGAMPPAAQAALAQSGVIMSAPVSQPVTPPAPILVSAGVFASPPAPAWGSAVFPAAQPMQLSSQVVVTEEPKEKKVKKADKKGTLSVLFNCSPTKIPDNAQPPTQLIELLGPIMRQVADTAGKAHWLLIPYNDGKAMLSHAFDHWLHESGWKGTLIVDSSSPESNAVREVLLQHADVVMRGYN